MAMTLNTPGPVDPILVNHIKSTVIRCTICREKSTWHDSAETIAYKQKREKKQMKAVGLISGFGFLFGGLYIVDQGSEGTTGLAIGTFVASAIFFLIGLAS